MTGNQGYGINPTPVNLQRTSRTSSLELWHHSTSSSSKMDLQCHEGSTLQSSSQQYWIGNSKDDDDDDNDDGSVIPSSKRRITIPEYDLDGRRLSIRSSTASHLSPSLLIINKQHSGGQKDLTNVPQDVQQRAKSPTISYQSFMMNSSSIPSFYSSSTRSSIVDCKPHLDSWTVTPPTGDSRFGYNASLASAIEERISIPSSVSDGSGIENLIPVSDGGGIENPIPVSDEWLKAFLMIWVIIMKSVLGSAQEAYEGEMRRQKKNKWG
ncbi:unnamed protein product [Sphagnum troendelagicum]|uniref:Uncharacterized protein n=1 Tax=Sphagnum troendelagicum TaxID=128251 RepID=A0ABP0U5J9_9BRYO